MRWFIKCYLCLFTSLKSVYKLSSLQHNTKCGQLKKCHDLCKAYWVSNSVFDYTKSIAPLSYSFPLNFMILWQCLTETKSSTHRKTGTCSILEERWRGPIDSPPPRLVARSVNARKTVWTGSQTRAAYILISKSQLGWMDHNLFIISGWRKFWTVLFRQPNIVK